MRCQPRIVAMPFLMVAFVFLGVATIWGEVVTIESTDGGKLKVRLVSCDGIKLSVIRASDKKPFDIPLVKLAESSQDIVKNWQAKGGNLAENFGIEIITGKNRKKTRKEDFDDKRVNLDPKITITNQDPKRSSRKAKVTALFLGRPVLDSKALHVFKKITHDLPSLEERVSKEFAIGKISAAYDSRGYAKFGSRYTGYIILIHDEKMTKIYASKAVPSALTSGEQLRYLSLESGADYDRNFKKLALPKYSDPND